MRILLLRSLARIPYGATFAALDNTGVGATEGQLLLHARSLTKLRCSVSVLGVTEDQRTEEGVTFLATRSPEESLQLLRSLPQPELVLVNSPVRIREVRAALPKALLFQVCQNGPHFEYTDVFDAFVMVSSGQLAYYGLRYPAHRHRYLLVPNVPPWEAIYSRLPPRPAARRVTWVGALGKQGLRRWAKVMSVVLQADPSLEWVVCCPSYSQWAVGEVPEALRGIVLPKAQVRFLTLSRRELGEVLADSICVLASLGGEDAGVAYLDGHAAGIPVLCADDIVGLFSAPTGTSLRCTTTEECLLALRYLLETPAARDLLGGAGREWIGATLTESHQEAHLRGLISFARLLKDGNYPAKRSVQSDRKYSGWYYLERLEIKIANLRRAVVGRRVE